MISPSQGPFVFSQASRALSASGEAPEFSGLSAVAMTATQPSSPSSAGPAAFSHAETREQILTAWINAAPHEQDRPRVAEMIREHGTRPEVPLCFEDLDISSLPNCLPEGLEALLCKNCPRLTALPARVPVSLVGLLLENCTVLSSLKLYPQLNFLILDHCPVLQAVDELPGALEILTVTQCPMFNSLPARLPEAFQRLTLDAGAEITLPDTLLGHAGLQISGYRFENIALGWFRRAGLDEDMCRQKLAALASRAIEEGYPQFISLLNRLYGEPVTEVDANAVVGVIEAVITDDKACRWIFAESERADHDCHARPLLILNTVGSLAKVGMLAKTAGGDPGAWINACKSLLKERLLDEIVPHVHRRSVARRFAGWNQNEMLPMQRELRQRLADELGLLFRDSGQLQQLLSSDDVKFAADYVKNAMADDVWVVEGLISLPVWETYALERLKDDPRYVAIETAGADEWAQCEALADSGKMSRGDLVKAGEAWVAKRQQAIIGLLRQDAAFWLGVSLS